MKRAEFLRLAMDLPQGRPMDLLGKMMRTCSPANGGIRKISPHCCAGNVTFLPWVSAAAVVRRELTGGNDPGPTAA